MAVGDGMWVTVRYRLFDSQGEPLEEGERELTYLHGGYGNVFPKIESALDGCEPGFSTSVYLQPEDGFGEYDADLIDLAPRAEFPEQLEVGMTFERLPDDNRAGATDPTGIYTVTDFNDEAVVLDGNHPLAGMALRFDVEVTGVRPASDEEMERERAQASGPPDAANAQVAASDDDADTDAHADERSGVDAEHDVGPPGWRDGHRLH
jgi:FKBP-type peptidyl-prolyl cis-trans isomerase SlyD